MVTQDNSDLLTPKIAAELTGYNPTTFNGLLSIGKLRGTKDAHNRWTFTHAALKEYFEGRPVNELKPGAKAFLKGQPFKSPTPRKKTKPPKPEATPEPSEEKPTDETELDEAIELVNNAEEVFREEIEELKTKLSERDAALIEAQDTIKAQQKTLSELHNQIAQHNVFLMNTLKEFMQIALNRTPDSQSQPPTA